LLAVQLTEKTHQSEMLTKAEADSLLGSLGEL